MKLTLLLGSNIFQLDSHSKYERLSKIKLTPHCYGACVFGKKIKTFKFNLSQHLPKTKKKISKFSEFLKVSIQIWTNTLTEQTSKRSSPSQRKVFKSALVGTFHTAYLV